MRFLISIRRRPVLGFLSIRLRILGSGVRISSGAPVSIWDNSVISPFTSRASSCLVSGSNMEADNTRIFNLGSLLGSRRHAERRKGPPDYRVAICGVARWKRAGRGAAKPHWRYDQNQPAPHLPNVSSQRSRRTPRCGRRFVGRRRKAAYGPHFAAISAGGECQAAQLRSDLMIDVTSNNEIRLLDAAPAPVPS